MTWARFRDYGTDLTFTLWNTHLDYHSRYSREQSARFLRERARREFGAEERLILLGDFNSEAGASGVHDTLTQQGWFCPVTKLARARLGPVGTHPRHAEQGRVPQVDWILCHGPWRVETVKVVAWDRDEGVPSDHFAVSAELEAA